MHVLALDFDGVISDSGPEAFVVALRTYEVLRPSSALTLASSPELRREAISQTSLYAQFVEGMPLGNRAEDFGIVLAAIDGGVPLPDQAAYDVFKASVEAKFPSFLADFHARFYQERDAFAAADPEAWHALLGPYPEFVELLARRRSDVQLAIATAKDRPAVNRLLAAYGIEQLFAPELVRDKETGVSKRAHLEALHRATGVAYEAITFVDDKVNHLEDVAVLGVRCALAGWGYNSEREKQRALELGYLVCELGDAEAQLFGSPPA